MTQPPNGPRQLVVTAIVTLAEEGVSLSSSVVADGVVIPTDQQTVGLLLVGNLTATVIGTNLSNAARLLMAQQADQLAGGLRTEVLLALTTPAPEGSALTE